MKRLVLLACAALLSLGAAAQAVREIRSVDIRAELQPDGSAWITQVWDVEAGSSGTEFYIPIGNLGKMTVSDLHVWDGETEFESLGTQWDVDRSRSWKSGKCGIVTKSNGVELCWGLGEAGDHVWTVLYYVTGLVQAYDDADAFNFMFVNKGMEPAPQQARVTVVPDFDCPAWTYDNTRVWAFGFSGEINVKDGAVVAETDSPMGYSSALIALVKFEKGLFQPAVEKGGPVQDLIDRALDGSSYGEEEDGGFFAVLMGLLFMGGIGTLVWAAVAKARGFKWKTKIFGKKKIDEWYRDVPLEGNLFAAEYLLSKGQRFGTGSIPAQDLIGALFLRWILNGQLAVQPDPKSAKRVNLVFKAADLEADSVEQDLYRWARSAAGDNLILEKGEFERWSTKNYSQMTSWPERAVNWGESWLRSKGYFAGKGETTPEGAVQACHVIEFQNFLKNFTLSDQREANEVKLWKEYLVYAQLFGIAEKVTRQFQKLYPAQFDQLARQTGMDSNMLLNTTLWTHSMSTRAFSGATAKAGAVNGTGGRASFGGGGGFSGGGFGGGGR